MTENGTQRRHSAGNRDALDNDIPSDYDDSTYESEEETELRLSSLDTIQQDFIMV